MNIIRFASRAYQPAGWPTSRMHVCLLPESGTEKRVPPG
jgi:hypothetical protein